jgi:hypothetical protein
MSELISSRAWRALSRAAVMQASTEPRLETSNTSASTSAAGLVGRAASPAHFTARAQPREIPAVLVDPAIQLEVEADVEQPDGMPGALEIAGDPVERVGDARLQHDRISPPAPRCPCCRRPARS